MSDIWYLSQLRSYQLELESAALRFIIWIWPFIDGWHLEICQVPEFESKCHVSFAFVTETVSRYPLLSECWLLTAFVTGNSPTPAVSWHGLSWSTGSCWAPSWQASSRGHATWSRKVLSATCTFLIHTYCIDLCTVYILHLLTYSPTYFLTFFLTLIDCYLVETCPFHILRLNQTKASS